MTPTEVVATLVAVLVVVCAVAFLVGAGLSR